jgi:hypothetical protein
VSTEVPADIEQAIQLEERAHRLRLVMFRTPGLLDRLQAGYEASERGEVLGLLDLDHELAKLD